MNSYSFKEQKTRNKNNKKRANKEKEGKKYGLPSWRQNWM